MTVEEVKKIWEQVLGVEDIDVTKRFYDMGGNSITLLIILDEVRKSIGLELDVADMDKFDSVTNMQQYIASKIQIVSNDL
jgi:acyl carrier protein